MVATADLSTTTKFDNLFLTIAEGAQGIDNLMDCFFSFLARKTDFYLASLESGDWDNKELLIIKDEKNQEPPLAVTLRYYRKHRGIALERHRAEREGYQKIDDERRRKRLEHEHTSLKQHNNHSYNHPQTSRQSSLQSSSEISKSQTSGLTIQEITSETETSPNTESPLLNPLATTHPTSHELPSITTNQQHPEKTKMVSEQQPSSSVVSSTLLPSSNISNSSTTIIDPHNNDESPDHEEAPPVGNGGKTDKYTWTQLLPSVDVYISVPPRTTARDCKVTITASSIRVVVQNNVIVDGQLHQKIKPDDSLWTLEDGLTLHLVLEKLDGMRWWNCVIVGDPCISTQKIVPENSKLSDLDPELRQTVEKMMFDQEQKARGLPSSDQLRQHEILEKFKAAHPEMDFSQAKINWGGMNGGGGI